MQETLVRFLGQEDPLEEEMATHSRILAWEIAHYSWNRWTAALWAMYKSMRILLPFPLKKTHWVRQELEIRPCNNIYL